MKIVADENIRYVEEAFEGLGDVETMPGRQISSEHVVDAELLLVRSVTSVGPDLLEGSNVQFVGTATIGVDHIDRKYLDAHDIAFSSAAGSNANSVAEYVVSALLTLSRKGEFRLEDCSIGVVGVGNVGSRVVEKARALGMEPVLNDPPLRRKTGETMYRPIEEALSSDIVTVHVPLTRSGPDATYHMVDAAFLENMNPQGIFINTARGDVVEEAALLDALDQRHLSAVCLDVWSNEPEITPELLGAVDVGTPHIAGYSLDGKAAGTAMICEAACRFLDVSPPVDVMSLLPDPDVAEYTVDSASGDAEDIIRDAVFEVYDVRKDDARLRRVRGMPEGERGRYFDDLRRNYPTRREFYNTRLDCTRCTDSVRRKLLELGFSEQ